MAELNIKSNFIGGSSPLTTIISVIGSSFVAYQFVLLSSELKDDEYII